MICSPVPLRHGEWRGISLTSPRCDAPCPLPRIKSKETSHLFQKTPGDSFILHLPSASTRAPWPYPAAAAAGGGALAGSLVRGCCRGRSRACASSPCIISGMKGTDGGRTSRVSKAAAAEGSAGSALDGATKKKRGRPKKGSGGRTTPAASSGSAPPVPRRSPRGSDQAPSSRTGSTDRVDSLDCFTPLSKEALNSRVNLV